MTIALATVQKRLTYIWLLFAATMLVFNIFAAGFEGEVSQIGWAWYSTAILPTTGLIMGMWVSILRDGSPSNEMVNSTSSFIALVTMIFYICTIFLTLTVVCGNGGKSILIFYKSSQQWIGYIQTPMLAFIGIIFAHKNERLQVEP